MLPAPLEVVAGVAAPGISRNCAMAWRGFQEPIVLRGPGPVAGKTLHHQGFSACNHPGNQDGLVPESAWLWASDDSCTRLLDRFLDAS